jgi:hypothetical protein
MPNPPLPLRIATKAGAPRPASGTWVPQALHTAPKKVNATSYDVISTGGGALAAAVEKSAVAFAVACTRQRHPKTKTVISTEGGDFHRLDSQNIATSKSKIPQHSHSLNLPQKLPVFSRGITK